MLTVIGTVPSGTESSGGRSSAATCRLEPELTAEGSWHAPLSGSTIQRAGIVTLKRLPAMGSVAFKPSAESGQHVALFAG